MTGFRMNAKLALKWVKSLTKINSAKFKHNDAN